MEPVGIPSLQGGEDVKSVAEAGGILTVVGTVNGIPVALNISMAGLGINLASAVAFQQFIFPAMLAAVPPNATSYPSLTATITQ
jgi:hypothetical protein